MITSSPSYPTYSVGGDRYIFLLTGAETGGAYAVIDALVPPGGGTPPHVHSREDETFHVLEGEMEFVVDGEAKRLGKGEFLFAPRGIPHYFKNVGTGPAKMILTMSPAGFENYFAEIGTLLDGPQAAPVPPTKEDIEKLISTAPKYGITILG